jgi:hypothetical protein
MSGVFPRRAKNKVLSVDVYLRKVHVFDTIIAEPFNV